LRQLKKQRRKSAIREKSSQLFVQMKFHIAPDIGLSIRKRIPIAHELPWPFFTYKTAIIIIKSHPLLCDLELCHDYCDDDTVQILFYTIKQGASRLFYYFSYIALIGTLLALIPLCWCVASTVKRPDKQLQAYYRDCNINIETSQVAIWIISYHDKSCNQLDAMAKAERKTL